MENLGKLLEEGLDAMQSVTRYILPAVAFFVLIICVISLLRNRPKVTTMAHLINAANGDKIPLAHWETSIGRSKSCDICLAYNTVSRFHAVIARRKEKWMIYDTQSKLGVMVNNEKINLKTEIYDGDTIILGTALFTFRATDAPQPKREVSPANDNTFYDDEPFYSEEQFNIPVSRPLGRDIPLEYEDISSTFTEGPAIVNENKHIPLYLTGNSMVIGSAPDSPLYCEQAESHHARIERLNGGWAIEDLNSESGVKINNTYLKSAQRLFDGDKIILGDSEFTFYENYRG